MQQYKKEPRRSFFTVFLCQQFPTSHRMCRKDLLIFPPDRLASGEGLGDIQQALVGAAAEAQGDVMLGLNEAAIDQNIQQLQKFVGDFAPGGAGFPAGQLLPSVAGIAPDRFVRVECLEVADEGQKLPLIFRLHRLAAQQGQARDVVRLAGSKDFIPDGFIKRFAVSKVPSDLIEAAGTMMAAARDEHAGTDAGAVCDVIIFDGCVIHMRFFLQKAPPCGRAEMTKITDAGRGP